MLNSEALYYIHLRDKWLMLWITENIINSVFSVGWKAKIYIFFNEIHYRILKKSHNRIHNSNCFLVQLNLQIILIIFRLQTSGRNPWRKEKRTWNAHLLTGKKVNKGSEALEIRLTFIWIDFLPLLFFKWLLASWL